MAVVATGFFDGVHRGHRVVLSALTAAAHGRGTEAVVVTFWPHPRAVLQQDARELHLLTSLEEKQELLRGQGVDRVEVLPFSRAFAAMDAEAYLRTVLRDRLGAEAVVVGYDNRLGHDSLTASQLRPLARKLGLEVLVPGREDAPDGVPVSSTLIRRGLEAGEVAAAGQMLGYRYGLCGVVVAGNRLGRTIGFPTANMKLYEPLKLVPGNGVYATEAEVLGRVFRGMTNIGTRPTVGGTARTIETHLLDFDEDIYGLPLRIRFLRKIRDEIRFPSLDSLREQLERDAHAIGKIRMDRPEQSK